MIRSRKIFVRILLMMAMLQPLVFGAETNSVTRNKESGAESKSTNAADRRSDRDIVFFRNGDLLYGALNSIEPDAGVKWSRPDSAGPFQFNSRQVSEILLSGMEAPSRAASSNFCALQLNNGDQLHGILSGYDGQTIKLDTWFGGTMEFPRESVAMLLPIGLPRTVVFEGPDGIEGWTSSEVDLGAAAQIETGKWIYHNHALYAGKSASIARDVHLPDVSSLSFDMEWRGFFHLAVALYTQYLHPINLQNKETEPKFGGFYSLQLNPFSANLLPVKQNEPLRYLGQSALQNLSQKSSAHIDLRVNKQKKQIALLIDGVLVKDWIDSDSFAGTGTAIRFVHQGQGAVKLSNIKVTEWDGQFDDPISITPNKTQDIARLRNGDRVPGAVKSIHNGKMKVEAPGNTLDIPMSRVKQIEFAGNNPPKKNSTNLVRAFFTNGGSLTFELQKWTPDALLVKSENFGTVTFKPNAFSRILFDLDADQSR